MRVAGAVRQCDSRSLVTSAAVPALGSHQTTRLRLSADRLVLSKGDRAERHNVVVELEPVHTMDISICTRGECKASDASEQTHGRGAKTRMPRTCVSLPFMWFEMMATWRRCARMGSLLRWFL